MRSTTPLRSTPPHSSPAKARADFLHRRAFALPPPSPPAKARVDYLHRRDFASPPHSRPNSANVFFQSDGILALHPLIQLDRTKRLLTLHIRAESKGKKPPPKPASRGIVIGAILLPLLMAGSAVAAGRILLAKIKKEAREEAEEWERRFNPSRLLPDGKSDEEKQMERENTASAESANVPSTRNRPKRME